MRISGSLLRSVVILALVVPMSWSVPTTGNAQSYNQYCHDRAQRLSGYKGRPGGVVGGAVQGAIGGAIISGILGGSKKDRKKAAKLGALLGGISGAQRPNSRAARIYKLEYEDCLRRR